MKACGAASSGSTGGFVLDSLSSAKSGRLLKCGIGESIFSRRAQKMFWLILEAGLALLLLILIVWWTLPGKKPRDHDDGELPR